MSSLFNATFLAAALTLSGCASMDMSAGSRGHGMMGGSPAADTGASGGMSAMMMGMMTPLVGCPGAQGDVEARLATLHAALQITPAQEAVWAAYAAAYRAHASQTGADTMGMHANDAGPPASVVDRLRRHDEMMSQHLASFHALRSAIEPLYAALGSEQKALADGLHCGQRS